MIGKGALRLDHEQATLRRRRQQLRQVALLGCDAGEVAEKLHVFPSDAGDHPHPGGGESDQRGQFTRVIGTHLQHGRLMMAFQPQQGRRQADVIVKTGLALEGAEAGRKECRDHFLGRGFTVGTRHANHRNVKLAPVGPGNTGIGGTRGIDDEERHPGRRTVMPDRGDHRRRTPLVNGRQIIVPVEAIPPQGNKQITFKDLPRIRDDPLNPLGRVG